eukprot:scaffold8011_cov149-Amphora_coffeaeformis.AAC.4
MTDQGTSDTRRKAGKERIAGGRRGLSGWFFIVFRIAASCRFVTKRYRQLSPWRRRFFFSLFSCAGSKPHRSSFFDWLMSSVVDYLLLLCEDETEDMGSESRKWGKQNSLLETWR